MVSSLPRVSDALRKVVAKANIATIFSIVALVFSASALWLSYSAYQTEYVSAEERINKHRAVATAFSEFVDDNCIDERTPLCDTYIRNTKDYLHTYASSVERESSRLDGGQYDSHLWEMQRIRITLAVAEL